MESLRAVSLFSGAGGLDAALEYHGIHVAAQIENDPYCNAVLALRWPGVPRYGDIKEINWHDFTRRHGPVDLVAGGFPCQPTSQAGRRKAQADPRWLWPEVARCVRVLRPRFVFLENTLGLLSRGVDDVLGDLAALRFDAVWDCFQAADVGAPHERDRVFVLAYLADTDDGEPNQPESAGRTTDQRPSAGWGELRVGGRSGPVADAAGGGYGGPDQQGPGPAGRGWLSSNGGPVADAAGVGLAPGPSGAGGPVRDGARREEPRRPRGSSGGESLADPGSAGLEVEREQHARRECPTAERGRPGMVDPPGAGRGPAGGGPGPLGGSGTARRLQPWGPSSGNGDGDGGAEPGLGRGPTGPASWMDSHRWPAPPGPEQYPWEPPRTVGRGEIPNRALRVKVLGNLVVPQQGALALAVLWQRMEAELTTADAEA